MMGPTEKTPLALPGPQLSASKRSSRTPATYSRWLLVLFAFIVLLSPHFYRHTIGDLGPVPPLSQEFIRQCEDLLNPAAGYYSARISRLADVLDNDTLWVAEPGTSAEYFLGGFSSRDWWLSERPLLTSVSSKGEVTILTAKFEQSRAEMVSLPKEIREKTTFIPWLESESPYAVLAEHLSGKKVVLDGQVRSFIASGLVGEHFTQTNEEMLARVKELRERKDTREIGLLRCANQMTLHGIRKTKARMHLGISESRAHAILLEEMSRIGLQGPDGLVLFGENAALPHGEGSDRRLKREDLILIDAGGKWGGYIADVTRTFALTSSKIPPSHLEVWDTVRQAQAAAYTALLASSQPHFAELDSAARNIVSAFAHQHSKPKQPDYSVFTTRLGHGIGLDGHESPFVNQGPQGEREVKSGHVFSLEPGIYIPEDMRVRGMSGVGVRLEDCFVVVEKDGKLDGEWLTGPVKQWGDI